jgi:hypothetical protein
MRPDTDHLDTRPSQTMVGSTPLSALRIRAKLVGSEVESEWKAYAAACPQLAEAVSEVTAAIEKLRTIIAQETK